MAAFATRSAAFLGLAAVLCVLVGEASAQQLSPSFYSRSCPNLASIVRSGMTSALQTERRMGASILRLFFHDCFVNGCDGSILLDDTSTFTGEKNAGPNANSARGFEVIDALKTQVEAACRATVSCADILALAARDGVNLLGGPTWSVPLGRKDSRTASQSAANANLPGPGSSLATLITMFDNAYYQNLVGQRGLLHSDQELFNGGSQDALVRQYSNSPSQFSADFVTAMLKMGGLLPSSGTQTEVRLNCRRPN
ncbi:unnamed protein product [Triticum turgidum subsp. durum]|uniref:Peroxidase 1 n=1 Tax=Triticum turgidum subsp. durum TaxID=4567 RepID=A0A9R1A7W9_TRITD|nr:unnamed protein product [Triticum turgidum subsp. durum]